MSSSASFTLNPKRIKVIEVDDEEPTTTPTMSTKKLSDSDMKVSSTVEDNTNSHATFTISMKPKTRTISSLDSPKSTN